MPGTILVVDDDRDIRDVIRLALEERGYEIIDADDGEAGLAQFVSVLPDLSILDVGLPGASTAWNSCARSTRPIRTIPCSSSAARPRPKRPWKR